MEFALATLVYVAGGAAATALFRGVYWWCENADKGVPAGIFMMAWPVLIPMWLVTCLIVGSYLIISEIKVC